MPGIATPGEKELTAKVCPARTVLVAPPAASVALGFTPFALNVTVASAFGFQRACSVLGSVIPVAKFHCVPPAAAVHQPPSV